MAACTHGYSIDRLDDSLITIGLFIPAAATATADLSKHVYAASDVAIVIAVIATGEIPAALHSKVDQRPERRNR